VFVSNLLMQVREREVRGSGMEIAEFRAEDTLHQLSDCLGDTVHLETCWCSMVVPAVSVRD